MRFYDLRVSLECSEFSEFSELSFSVEIESNANLLMRRSWLNVEEAVDGRLSLIDRCGGIKRLVV